MVRVDWPVYALFMHKKNPLRITKGITLTELAPGPYFSIVNVYLGDINVFTRFDEIQSLPVENIKEKPKCCRRMDRQRENSIPLQGIKIQLYRSSFFKVL